MLCAVGYSPLKTSTTTSSEPLIIDPSRVSVTFLPADASAPLHVLVKGEPEIMDEARASEVIDQSEITIEIDLGIGKESTTYWTCDLSHVGAPPPHMFYSYANTCRSCLAGICHHK